MRRTSPLRIIRVGLGFPLYEMAEVSRLSPDRLSRIERGLLKPTPEEIERISQALGVYAAAAMPLATQLIDLLQRTMQESNSDRRLR